MYKLLVFFIWFLSCNLHSQSSLTINNYNLSNSTRINLNIGTNLNKNYRSGTIIIVSGLSLMIAGYFLPPEQYITPSGYKIDKPFIQQGLRPIIVISGVVLTTVGVVIKIKDKNSE